ncbi:uncharacterized protein Hap1MRO34_004113 [Clarias gariepinus]|uniref:uncharacterized protein LOC128518584 n=1 Tax=Clarias gariepinus TaxID=13013 RepID=UPI00234DD035|nr:uncharacterized protein LOC128518584 [Clarias gariepinus]
MIAVHILVLGNTMNSHRLFMDRLKTKVKLREVSSVNECDYIIAFVPIVSRAGTDIQAAVEKIPTCKPVVLVVLHHTFDACSTPPDSRLCINRDRMFAVDCLFYEDQGLLKCQRNDKALTEMKEHLDRKEHSEVTQEVDPCRPVVDDSYSIQNSSKENIYRIVSGVSLVALVGGVYLYVCVQGYKNGHLHGFMVGYDVGYLSSY